jgi:hypothetical protein
MMSKHQSVKKQERESRLARKIEEKLGREHNPEIAFQIIMATSKQARAAQIPDLLKQIRPFVTEV